MATAEELREVDCEAPPLEGIRAVLRARLSEMCDLRAAALQPRELVLDPRHEPAEPRNVPGQRLLPRALAVGLRAQRPQVLLCVRRYRR